MTEKKYTFLLPVKVMSDIAKLARKDDRSVRSYITKILTDHIKLNKK